MRSPELVALALVVFAPQARGQDMTRADTVPPAAAMESPYTIHSGHLGLGATLTVPRGARGTVPIAVIIAGSGPTDRNGNSVMGIRPNSYAQYSGTSMAAGVVSGAVALLLDEKQSLKPADVKAALQLTSTFMPSAGLLGAGAGEIDVVAAAQLVDTKTFTAASIAGESIALSGIAFVSAGDDGCARERWTFAPPDRADQSDRRPAVAFDRSRG